MFAKKKKRRSVTKRGKPIQNIMSYRVDSFIHSLIPLFMSAAGIYSMDIFIPVGSIPYISQEQTQSRTKKKSKRVTKVSQRNDSTLKYLAG